MKNFIDRLAHCCQQEWQQPGLAFSIVHGKEAFCASYGVRRSAEVAEVDEHTRFALASCSKPFAVAAAFILQARGQLNLDDRVDQYVDELSFSDDSVINELSIRDLMCNYLGLLSSEGRHRQVAHDRKDLLARMKYQPFRHKFRSTYGYCTDAFTLLGEVLESASGLDLAACLEELLFQPLGMISTGLCYKASQKNGNFASPHLWRNGKLESIDWVYEDHVAAPAGGVNSTASDMLKWLNFLLTGTSREGVVILPKEQLELSRIAHTVDMGPYSDRELSQAMGRHADLVKDEAYALGWYTHVYLGARVHYHTGAIDGFRSLTGYIESLNFAVSILVNGDNPFLPRMLFQSIIDCLMQVKVADWNAEFARHQAFVGGGKTLCEFPAASLSENEVSLLEPLLGHFIDNTGFGSAKIQQEGGVFIMTVGALVLHLRPISKHKFEAYKVWPYCTGAYFVGQMLLDSKGNITAFTTSQSANFSRIS